MSPEMHYITSGFRTWIFASRISFLAVRLRCFFLAMIVRIIDLSIVCLVLLLFRTAKIVALSDRRKLDSQSIEPCVNESTISYHRSGQVAVLKTFATCIENVLDPLLFEGYATQQSVPFKAQISLNNLVEVNEVQNTVTIDFLLRVYWTDSRLDMPAMWEALGPEVSASGIDLIQYMEVNGNAFWLPDFVFSEASTIDITNSFIKLYPGGYVYWNRHFQMALFSTNLKYQKYPEDTQEVILRFFSYTIGDDLLSIEEKEPGQGVVLYPNYDSSPAIIHNPVWEYRSAYAGTQITDFGTATGAITRSVFVVHLNISRRANGIILKLALPMLFLALMGAMSFWTSVEERISTTMTVLLAISALYIVVFANIPMLGYLTKFDKFVVELTTILFFITATHHIVIRYQRDDILERHPLRRVCLRLFDFFGRVVLIPLMLVVYLTLFNSFSSAVLAFFVIVLGISAAIGYRESGSVKNSFVAAVDVINAMSQDPDQKDTLTAAERYTLQFLRSFSYTFSPVLPTGTESGTGSGAGSGTGVGVDKGAKKKDIDQFYGNKDVVLASKNPYFRVPTSPNNNQNRQDGNINNGNGNINNGTVSGPSAAAGTMPSVLSRRVLTQKAPTPVQVEMPRSISTSALQGILSNTQSSTANNNGAINSGSSKLATAAGNNAAAGTGAAVPPSYRPRTEARQSPSPQRSQNAPNTVASSSAWNT